MSFLQSQEGEHETYPYEQNSFRIPALERDLTPGASQINFIPAPDSVTDVFSASLIGLESSTNDN